MKVERNELVMGEVICVLERIEVMHRGTVEKTNNN